MGGRGKISAISGSDSETRRNERQDKNEKYKEFEDMPGGTHHYSGNGSEQIEFFKKNSNSDELISKMSNDEIRQFDRVWVPGEFMSGEGYKDWNNMSNWAKNAIKVYDKYLDQSYLDKGIVVARLATAELLLGKGNKFPTSIEQLRALEGQVIISRGNMSTGAAKHGLTIGAPLTTNPKGDYEMRRGKSVEYKIHIPGGNNSKGAGMWIGDRRVNSGFGAEQREFMMNRDIRLRVGKTRYDSKRDVYVVDLTYDGRREHRYS